MAEMKRLAGRESGARRRAPRKKKAAAIPIKNPRLPGMEDPAIQELESAAIEHSELKAEMVADRAAMKDKLKAVDARIIKLMEDNGKKTYNHAGVTLKLRDEKNVSVKVKRHDKKESE